MPLSEEEARLLEQLERSLSAEDPEFASALRGSKIADQYRRIYRRIAVLSGLGCIVGIVVLLAGAIFSLTWLGVLGFIAMVAGGYGLSLPWRLGILPGQVESAPRPTPKRARQTLVERMEQRWQDRKDDGPF